MVEPGIRDRQETTVTTANVATNIGSAITKHLTRFRHMFPKLRRDGR